MTTAHDIQILSQTAYGEDRQDGLEGMVAVCWVVRNRMEIAAQSGRKQFGDGTYAGACLAPSQFSCWGQVDSVNYRAMISVTLNDPTFQLATLAALLVITGQAPDPTGGAAGYFANTIATPAWAAGKTSVIIGSQTYSVGV